MMKATQDKSSATINWKQVSKAAGKGANITFNVIMPYTHSTAVNSGAAMREVRLAARTQRIASRAQKNLMGSTARESRKAMDVFNSAFRDIEKGEYTVDRLNGDMYNTFTNDIKNAFELPTGDKAAGMSQEEITLTGQRGIAEAVVESGANQLRGMNQISAQLLSSNARNMQAMSRSVNAIVSQNISMLTNTLYITNSKIDQVNSSVQQLVRFHNENTTKFYQTSIDMMNGLGKMMENLNTNMAPKVKGDRHFDTSRGFNIKAYIDYVKEGLMESLMGSTASTMHQIGVGSLKNPKGLASILLESFLPKSVSKVFTSLDKDISRMTNELLEQLADRLDRNPMFASLGLGGIFGNRRRRLTDINMAEYSKDALPWNGLAQKSLTEVIPDYLASIESKLTGMEERYFDYASGKFLTKSKIQEQYEKENLDRFRIALNEPLEKLTAAVQANSRPQKEKDNLLKEIENLLSDQIAGATDTKTTRARMMSKMTEFGMNPQDIQNFIKDSTDALRDSMTQIQELNAQVSQTMSKYRFINNKDGQDISQSIRTQFKQRKVDFRKQSRIGNPATYIRNVLTGLNPPLDKYPIWDDPEVQNAAMTMAYFDATDEDILLTLRGYYQKAAQANLVTTLITGAPDEPIDPNDRSLKARLRRGGRKLKTAAEGAVPKAQHLVDQVNSTSYDLVYGDKMDQLLDKFEQLLSRIPIAGNLITPTPPSQTEPLGSGKIGSTHHSRTFDSRPMGFGPAAATTLASKKKDLGGLSGKETDDVKTLEDLANTTTNRVLAQSEARRVQNDLIMGRTMEDLSKTDPANTVQGSIIQSNNMTRAAMATMVASFKNFGSYLFGKDGWISKMWNSDTRKKITGKLFTDEDAIFGDQYQAVKKWAQETWAGTKTELGKGYDYIREQALKYRFGENYQDSEAYKNSRFWSQWTNRDWHKQRKAERQKVREERELLKKKHVIVIFKQDIVNPGVALSLPTNPGGIQNYFLVKNGEGQDEKIKGYVALKFNGSVVSIQELTEEQFRDLTSHGVLTVDIRDMSADKVVNSVATPVKQSSTNKPNDLLGLPAPKMSSVHDAEAEFKRKRKEILTAAKAAGQEVDSSIYHKQLADLTNQYRNKSVHQPIMISGQLEDTSKQGLMVINNSLMEIDSQVRAAGEAVVGNLDEAPEKKKEKFITKFKADLKNTLPKTLAAGIAGAGVGLLNSHFSLLGSMFLPGGPISGAIVGAGLSILTNTEAFKTFMFGELDPKTNQREGGLINSKLRESIKKAAPMVIGGAAVGALHGAVKSALGFHGGLGIMGMQLLPGGILGGAMLGAGLGLLKHSEKFKEMIFGKKDESGKRSGKWLSDSFNKVKAGMAKAVPTLGKGLKGAGIGALSGAVLANMGYLPAMLSFGGPVGMGIAGFGLGIASSTSKFNEWLFGSKELDENGNPTGKRHKDGMLTRVTNLLNVNVIQPISNAFKNKMLDLVDWTKDKITAPFRLAFGPILDSILQIKDNVVDFVKDKFDAIGAGIMSIFKNVFKALFKPVTKLVGGIGKGIAGILGTGARVALSPLAALANGAALLTSPARRRELKEYRKGYNAERKKGAFNEALEAKWAEQKAQGNAPGLFQRLNDRWDVLRGRGEIADAYREAYNEEMYGGGENHLGWRDVYSENRRRKANTKTRKKDNKKWDKIFKASQTYANKMLNGAESTLNKGTFERMKKHFVSLGVDESALQTNEDMMDLIYRGSQFRSRLEGGNNKIASPGEDVGKGIADNPELKTYRDRVVTALEKLAGIAHEEGEKHLTEKHTREEEETWEKDRKRFRDKLKANKIKGLDTHDERLRDWDIQSLSRSDLKEFKVMSEKMDVDHFIDWMYQRGVTQFSAQDNPEMAYKPKQGTPDPLAPIPNANGKTRVEILNDRLSEIEAELGIKTKDIAPEIVGKKDKAGQWHTPDGKFATSEQARFNDFMEEIINIQKELLSVNKDQVEATEDLGEMQINTITEGEGDRNDIAKNKGHGLSGLINRLRHRKKSKEDRDAREAEDAERLKSANGSEESDEKSGFWDRIKGFFGKKKEDEPKEKKQGIFSKIKGFFTKIGSTGSGTMSIFGKMGKFALNALKIGGSIAGIATVGFTIAELIKPGSTEPLAKKIKAATEAINDSKNGPLSLLGTIKSKVEKFWDEKAEPWIVDKKDKIIGWFTGTAWPWIRDEAIPAVSHFVLTAIPETAVKIAKFIGDNVETLANTVVKVTTTLVGPIAQLIWEVVKGLTGEIISQVKEFMGLGSKSTSTSTTVSNLETAQETVNNNFGPSTIVENPDGTYTVETKRGVGKRTAFSQNGKEVGVVNQEAVGTVLRTGVKLANPLTREAAKEGIKLGTLGAGKSFMGVTKTIGMLPGPVGWVGKAGYGIGKGISKIGNALAKGAGKLLGKGTTEAAEVAAENLAKSAAKNAAESVGKEVVESTALTTIKTILGKWREVLNGLSESGVLTKVCKNYANYVKDEATGGFIKKVIIKPLLGVLDKILTAPVKFANKIVSTLESAVAKMTGKSTVEIATAGIGALIFVGGGAILGAIDAAHLFGVPSEDVNGKMRFVSAIFGALSGTALVGTILDVFCVLMDLIFKTNFKKDLATGIYKAIATEEEKIEIDSSHDKMDAELAVYNAMNNTNLSASAYNDIRNKTIGGKIVDAGKSAINWVAGLWGGKVFEEEIGSGATEEALKKLMASGMSADQIQKMSTTELQSALKAQGYGTGSGLINLSNSYDAATSYNVSKWKAAGKFDNTSKLSVEARNAIKNGNNSVVEQLVKIRHFVEAIANMLKSYGSLMLNSNGVPVGYGGNPNDDGYYRQGNYNNRIGTFNNGKPSNMRQGGCGPTALSYVRNQLMGYGPISPGEMGAYAAKNGYISQGGANAGLFTEGAANLGMSGVQLGDVNQLHASLASGRPAILTGVGYGNPLGYGGNNPYTPAGHIVVADGVMGDQVSIMDPMTGKHKLYNINNVASKTTNAWSYSMGYGEGDNSVATINSMDSNTSKQYLYLRASTNGRNKICKIHTGDTLKDWSQKGNFIKGTIATSQVASSVGKSGYVLKKYVNYPKAQTSTSSSTKTSTPIATAATSNVVWLDGWKTYNTEVKATVALPANAEKTLQLLYKNEFACANGIDQNGVVECWLHNGDVVRLKKENQSGIAYIEILKSAGDTNTAGKSGYTHKSLLNLITINSTTVKSGVTNKMAPVTDVPRMANPITTLPKGTRVTILQEVSGYYKIGENQYVMKSFITLDGASTSTSRSGDPREAAAAIDALDLQTDINAKKAAEEAERARIQKVISDLWGEYEISTGGGAYGAFRNWFYSSKQRTSDGSGRYHAGLDMGREGWKRGAAIKAFTDGEVVRVQGDTGGRGYYVIVKDPNGFYHIYQHLNHKSNLNVGDPIQIGQKVGEQGSSDGGNGSGPVHLHYEIRTPKAGRDYNITSTYTQSGSKKGYILSKEELKDLTMNPSEYIMSYASGINPRAIYNGSVYDGSVENGDNQQEVKVNGLFGGIASNLFDPNSKAGAFFSALGQLGKNLWNAFKYKFGIDPSLFGFSSSDSENEESEDGSYTGSGGEVPAASIVTGSNNAETIWKTLRKAGYSKAGTAGLMGNLQAESALIPNNVQSSYLKDNPNQYRANYTSKVDNGSISAYDFIHKGPGGGGYGLAQWTYYTRKAGLLSAAQNNKTSVGDLGTQLSYMINELGQYGLTKTLKNATSIRNASDIILTKYEQPADQGSSVQVKRASYGQAFYNDYASRSEAEGYGPINRSQLLGLGKKSPVKLDNPLTFERSRKFIPEKKEEPVNMDTFKAMGFGPGMDVSVDSASTDDRLDKIFGLMAEWFAENKKAASSAQTKTPAATSANVNMIRNETHIQQNNGGIRDTMQSNPNKRSLITQHSQLAYRSNFTRSTR